MAATPEILGDVVLARKDVPTSYHLSVTVDDDLQGVTLVTRGEDLFHAALLVGAEAVHAQLAENAGARNIQVRIEERPWMHNSVLTYVLTWD